ncbi:MAG: sensor histidine kinase [Clostridiaceae bacterium]|nr:sensor histidine kinase [Clostridiaceae bacterium]
MIQKFKALPLNKQIILLIATLGIYILFISLYSTFTFYRQMTNTVESNQELYFNQLLLSCETGFEEIEHICSSVAYNQLVQNYLLETDPINKFTLYQHVINLLNNTKNLNDSIIDIALFGETKNRANISGDIATYNHLYEMIPPDIDSVYYFGKTEYYIANRKYTCIIAAMPIYNLSAGSRKIGVVFATINPAQLFGRAIFTDNIVSNELLFADETNQLVIGDEEIYRLVLSKEETANVFTVRKDNSTYRVRQGKVSSMGGSIYTYYNRSTYDNSMFISFSGQILLIIVAFIVISLLLLTIYKSISESLLQLNGVMKKIRSGKRSGLNERITLDPGKTFSSEVISTTTAFNEMLDEINRLNTNIFMNYTKLYEMEMIQKKTEIAFLRSQINPHFLYNTFSVICGMAAENQMQGVIDITQSLSQIFRYSICGDDIVTLEQELEVVKSYLLIQTSRFEDRFTVEFDCAKETLSALIPKMIIQPLVENAIVHGLEKSLKKGKLQIGSRINKDENALVIWIYDTGVGMPAEMLESIRRNLKRKADHLITEHQKERELLPETKKESIGLCNVNRRIALYFGESHGLHIDSEENVGTNIQIKIPFSEKRRLE